ncbi:MAG TPA: 23S rRNA (pseudouridine(1915)-N(3))-methyltransferase RlmH [Casimicrobiaceae bacterium]
MRLRVVALGHRMPGWVDAGFDGYAQRLPRDWRLELVELKPEPRERGRSIEQMLAAEASRIASACAGFRAVALDERGAAWSTRELASHLRGWQEARHDVAFVIGSADGLHADIKSHAAAVVALSAMTLPHGLVRVVLAEQIYRAASLLAGHPYHRD